MNLTCVLALASLAFSALTACQSDAHARDAGTVAVRAHVLEDATSGKQDAGPPAKGTGEKKKDEKEDKAEELRKKEHELDYARRELKIARLETESAGREAKNALDAAEFKLKEALDERDHYKTKESTLKIAGEALGIERSEEQRERQRQELAEIEAMYAKEDFAELTKELVIRRSRMDLVLAEKNLAIEQQKLADLRDHEIPQKTRALAEEVVKAEKSLAEAKAKLARHESEKELKLLKSEHAVENVEREITKLKAEIEKAKAAEKDAAAAKPEPQP